MLGRNRTRLLLSALILIGCAASARAATLAVEAPDGCVDLATLNQEVADLLGRPLAEVPDADFRLAITPARGGKWHLKLQATERRAGRAEGPHLRELDAMNCAALGDAAAVAIAVSVRALADAAPPPSPERPAPAIAASPAVPGIQVQARAARPSWRPGLRLSLAADAGELPGTGLGVMAGADLGRRGVRLAVTVGWLPARDTFPAMGHGGQFQLVFAAADACLAPVWGAWTVLGCVGAELGAYRATGLGVALPESQTTLWRAGRARIGTAVRWSESVALIVDVTGVIPLTRPAFVLDDGAQSVYQAGAVAMRVGAGLEFTF